MTAVPIWQAVHPRLTDPVPEPSDVGPGWVAFVVFVLLFLVTILLWLNMRKQLRRINFPTDEPEPQERADRPGPEQGPAPDDGAAPEDRRSRP